MFLLFFMLVGMRCSSAYPDGSVAGVCDSMVPKHNVFSPQSTAPPYRVRVTSSSYRPGDNITVNLEAVQNGTHFEGFMLQARRVVGGTVVGSFSSTNVGKFRLHSCFNQENSTISHSSGEMKSRFEATWVAPLTPSPGKIEFCATFVKDYANFWTVVSSDTIFSGSSGISNTSDQVLSFRILITLAVQTLEL